MTITVINLLSLSSKLTLQYTLCNNRPNRLQHLSCLLLNLLSRGHWRDITGGRSCAAAISRGSAAGWWCGYGLSRGAPPVLFPEPVHRLVTLQPRPGLVIIFPGLCYTEKDTTDLPAMKASCLHGNPFPRQVSRRVCLLPRSPPALHACAPACQSPEPCSHHSGCFSPAQTARQLWPGPAISPCCFHQQGLTFCLGRAPSALLLPWIPSLYPKGTIWFPYIRQSLLYQAFNNSMSPPWFGSQCGFYLLIGSRVIQRREYNYRNSAAPGT